MSRRQTRLFSGAKVREARESAGLTHEQLARQVNVTLRTVQRWQEGGEPRGAQLLELARQLDRQPDDFYIDAEAAA